MLVTAGRNINFTFKKVFMYSIAFFLIKHLKCNKKFSNNKIQIPIHFPTPKNLGSRELISRVGYCNRD